MPLLSGKHDSRKILLPVAVLASDDPADITHIKATALLDTGATCSPITPKIIQKLDLKSYEKRVVKVATEDRLKDFFMFRIGLFSDRNIINDSSNLIPYTFPDTDGFELQQTSDFDLIIGMDILSQCNFEMNRNGTWKLIFG